MRLQSRDGRWVLDTVTLTCEGASREFYRVRHEGFAVAEAASVAELQGYVRLADIVEEA